MTPLRQRLLLTVFDRVHNGFGVEYAEQYLVGLQWWENHRHLSHREKMIELARGLRWKKPTPSKSKRKWTKQAQQRET